MSIEPQELEAGNAYDAPARTIADVRDYIDRHYAMSLSIERLARLAALSPFHFIRAFRTVAGQTPHQYLRARRIDRARDLLVTTSMSVTDICDAVGFQSLGSFSTMFKRLTGETPAQYRAARRRRVDMPGCVAGMYGVDR